MARIQKRWVFLGCILLGGVGGPLFAWHQATQLPEWYGQPTIAGNMIDLSDRTALQQAEKAVESKLDQVQPAPDGTAEVELSEADINALLASEVARRADAQDLTAGVKRIKTRVNNGKIESGAVVNLSDLPEGVLQPQEQSLVTRLVQAFPALVEQDVYVGIEGTPTVTNGQVNLAGTQLRIGNLRFSLADVANQLGVSEADVNEELIRRLAPEQVGIQDVKLVGDRVRIRGTAN
jgi:hypothetical protein